MNKTIRFSVLMPFLLFCANATLGQSSPGAQSGSASQVLPLIETYKAPAYPESPGNDREKQDIRVSANLPVPDTRTDALVYDVWQRTQDPSENKKVITPQEVSEGAIAEAISVYLKKDWKNIAGFRPWTHWNFIRSLEPSQREALAKEIAAYIVKNGVRQFPTRRTP